MARKRTRKGLSASTRWTVFARDGFCCRYCGRQAGEEGVELAVDHVLSVAEGGDNRIDNLVTACKSCNSGKGSRSLRSIPTSKEVLERLESRVEADCALIGAMSSAIHQAGEIKSELEQQVVNMKCAAYEAQECTTAPSELSIAIKLCREFGPDLVIKWYRSAYIHNVAEQYAIRYVCGCARTHRKTLANEAAQNAAEDADFQHAIDEGDIEINGLSDIANSPELTGGM